MLAVPVPAIEAAPPHADAGATFLGTLLVDLGLLTHAQLDTALSIQSRCNGRRRLGDILIAQGIIGETRLIEVLSMQLGFPMLVPGRDTLDRARLARLGANRCTQHMLVPMRTPEGLPAVTMADPLDRAARQSALSAFGASVIVGISGKHAILDAIALAERDCAWTPSPGSWVEGDRLARFAIALIRDGYRLGAGEIRILLGASGVSAEFLRDGETTGSRAFDDVLAPDAG